MPSIIKRATATSLIILSAFFVSALGQDALAKKINDLVTPVAANGQFSGVVLASKDGKVIYEKAFGWASAELKVPNATNTRIGIASITKPMTGVVLIRLVEEGKLGMDDKLSKFVPDFPSGDKITVAMLSQHRSGILHRVMPEEQEALRYTSAEMVEKIKQAKLAFEPGTQRLYSSGGYAVLARVLEIASGKSYSDLLRKYVFEPAGMTDSLDWDGAALVERRAQDHLLDERGFYNAPIKDYSFLVGAGSVIGTAADLHRFSMAMVEGRYGANAKANFVRDGQFASSGSTNGHRAYIEMREDKSYGFVILSNLGAGSFEFAQKGVTEILQGKEPTVKTLAIPKLVPNPNKDLAEFAGRYQRTDGGSTTLVLKDGYLWSADIKLHPTKPDCFFDFKFFGNVCFTRDAGGKVSSFKWTGLTFELAGTKQ